MAGQGISGDHKDESIDSDDYVDGSVDTIHLADNAVTLAKMASGTDGNIISFDASGNPVAIATGNDGQILTSGGAGAAPAFAAPAALGANSVDSDNYVDGSIDAVHLAASSVLDAALSPDTTYSRMNLLDYGEVTNAIGSTGGGTQDINLELGNVVVATVDTSTNTFTFSNPTASDEGCSFTLLLTNGGSQTVNWPGTVDWAAATAPTLSASGLDILTFITVDGGTIWHGLVASTLSS